VEGPCVFNQLFSSLGFSHVIYLGHKLGCDRTIATAIQAKSPAEAGLKK